MNALTYEIADIDGRKPSVLFKRDVICGSCGTGHFEVPGERQGLCRKCDAELPAPSRFRRGDIMAAAAEQARFRAAVKADV